MDKIIDGKEISTNIRQELKNSLLKVERSPSLVVIQVGNNAASTVYVKNKEKAAEEIGITFKHMLFDNTTERELIQEIKNLNDDTSVDGIIVQLPLPKDINVDRVVNTVDPSKDVDGLGEISLGRLLNKVDGFLPCTPLGVIELLKRSNVDVVGKHVVVVGRSRLVGKPLANLLLNMDATVTICHSKTVNLSYFTSDADILIVAAGKRSLITAGMVKMGSIIIDVGINVEDGKLYGDVDFDGVLNKVSLITPVPGGVGPMTVTMLMKNTIDAYNKKTSN